MACIGDYCYNGKNVLWLGTDTGLNKFDTETGVFTRYPHTDRGFPYNYIETVLVDTLGFVWIGSSSDGLHKFDPKTVKI